MKSAVHTVLLVFSLLFGAGAANAENPLVDERELRKFLRKVWFSSRYDIQVKLVENERGIQEIRYFNLRGEDESGREYVFLNPEMIRMTEDWNISFHSPRNSPDTWKIPRNVLDCCYRYFKKHRIAQILFASRIPKVDSIKFSNWNEGSVEFAQAKGEYEFVNHYSGGRSTHSFRVLIERHPASDGWVLSNFRGEESYYDLGDTEELYEALRSR